MCFLGVDNKAFAKNDDVVRIPMNAASKWP